MTKSKLNVVTRSGMVLRHLGEGRYCLHADSVTIEGYYETIKLFFEGRFDSSDELEVACQNMDKEGNDLAYFGIFGVWLFGERSPESGCMAV